MRWTKSFFFTFYKVIVVLFLCALFFVLVVFVTYFLQKKNHKDKENNGRTQHTNLCAQMATSCFDIWYKQQEYRTVQIIDTDSRPGDIVLGKTIFNNDCLRTVVLRQADGLIPFSKAYKTVEVFVDKTFSNDQSRHLLLTSASPPYEKDIYLGLAVSSLQNADGSLKKQLFYHVMLRRHSGQTTAIIAAPFVDVGTPVNTSNDTASASKTGLAPAHGFGVAADASDSCNVPLSRNSKHTNTLSPDMSFDGTRLALTQHAMSPLNLLESTDGSLSDVRNDDATRKKEGNGRDSSLLIGRSFGTHGDSGSCTAYRQTEKNDTMNDCETSSLDMSTETTSKRQKHQYVKIVAGDTLSHMPPKNINTYVAITRFVQRTCKHVIAVETKVKDGKTKVLFKHLKGRG